MSSLISSIVFISSGCVLYCSLYFECDFIKIGEKYSSLYLDIMRLKEEQHLLRSGSSSAAFGTCTSEDELVAGYLVTSQTLRIGFKILPMPKIVIKA